MYDVLKEIRMIYVSLDSERFARNFERVTKEDPLAMVRNFKEWFLMQMGKERWKTERHMTGKTR